MAQRSSRRRIEVSLDVGGYPYAPEGSGSAHALMVRHSPDSDGSVHGIVALADGSPSGPRGDLASSLVLDALEAELNKPGMPTVGTMLALGARAARLALQDRSAATWDPVRLSAALAAAAIHLGNWTVLEAGGPMAFLARGKKTGAVFAHGPASVPLGADEGVPRIVSFPAMPGDVLMLVSQSLASRVGLDGVAEVLRSAPNLSEGCRAVIESVVAHGDEELALAAVRTAPVPARKRCILAAVAIALPIMVASAALGLVALTGGPSRPRVPPEARNYPFPLVAMPGESESAERAPVGDTIEIPGWIPLEPLADEESPGATAEPPATSTPPTPAPEAQPLSKSDIKVVGPPGTSVEVREVRAGGEVRSADVREGQESVIFYGLPAPATYRVSVWASPRRQRLVVQREVRLGNTPAKIDVTAESRSKQGG